AGRTSPDLAIRLTDKLREITVPGVQLFVEPVKDYRFVLALRGDNLSGRLSETDPQALGKPPLPVRALEAAARPAADAVNAFVTQARQSLADQRPANMGLLGGFYQLPGLAQ